MPFKCKKERIFYTLKVCFFNNKNSKSENIHFLYIHLTKWNGGKNWVTKVYSISRNDNCSYYILTLKLYFGCIWINFLIYKNINVNGTYSKEILCILKWDDTNNIKNLNIAESQKVPTLEKYLNLIWSVRKLDFNMENVEGALVT